MATTQNTNCCYEVTLEQLNACHRIVDLNNKQVFYLVEKCRSLSNDDGEIIMVIE